MDYIVVALCTPLERIIIQCTEKLDAYSLSMDARTSAHWPGGLIAGWYKQYRQV